MMISRPRTMTATRMPGRSRRSFRGVSRNLVVAVAVTAFSLAMYSYYTSTILATLESKAQTAAGMFRNYTETTYLYNARQFVNQFEEKNYIEVQILNASGRVQISSMMDISGAGVETSDVSSAIAEKRVVPYTGPDPSTGDHIIAASAPVVYNGTVVGVVRMVTSLRQVEEQMFRIIAFTSGMGLVILIVMGVTASYFIKSVLDPVIRVTETAKRIATGSYGVQMESRSNDEMGDLVDAINDMSMKIDQAERTQSEFISSVSHELRTPLTAIRGYLDLLAREDLPENIRRYLGRISGPVLDRIDMITEAAPVAVKDLYEAREAENTAAIKQRVLGARERQQFRYQKSPYHFNGELPGSEVKKYCQPSFGGQRFLEQMSEAGQISARAFHKILRLARTTADLEGREKIEQTHLAEAVCYNSGRRRFWNQISM